MHPKKEDVRELRCLICKDGSIHRNPGNQILVWKRQSKHMAWSFGRAETMNCGPHKIGVLYLIDFEKPGFER